MFKEFKNIFKTPEAIDPREKIKTEYKSNLTNLSKDFLYTIEAQKTNEAESPEERA